MQRVVFGARIGVIRCGVSNADGGDATPTPPEKK
jgi:hypothetical protein